MISILMSSYNPIEEYFLASIESILSQTYQDFELVIVDDCSNVPVEDLLKKNNIIFEKITIVRLEQNCGLPKALNIGLKYCKGEYIARMDDDDVMSPNRLDLQLIYMQEHSEYAGCWSFINRINSVGEHIRAVKLPTDEEKYLKILITSGNIFCHSSLFVKKDVLEEISGYDENFKYAQDSELYIRILEKYKMGMVKEHLVDFRINNYRNNYYRAYLSMHYALFGCILYYTRHKITCKNVIWIVKRMAKYIINILLKRY